MVAYGERPLEDVPGVQGRDLRVQVCPSDIAEEVELSSSDADYADVFVLTGRFREYSVDMWARALFEQAAGRMGQFVWRHVLRLKLMRPPSRHDRISGDDRVAGWRVAQRGDRWIRLAASGALLSGNLVVRVRPEQVFLGTYVWFDTRLGGWLWRRLAPIHHRSAPDLLREGLAALTRRT